MVPPAKNEKVLYLVFSVIYPRLKKNKRIIHNKFDSIKSELDHYKREQVGDLDDDPLERWKSNHDHYLLMAELVRKFWSLPATSVKSEEVFSVASGIVTKKRI